MKNELEQLRKEFNERIDALVKKETTVETGKWYKTENGAIVFVEDYGKNKKIGYGFIGAKGQTISFVEDWYNYNYEFTPAADKEVEEALIKEAIKRGFKEGVRGIPANKKTTADDICKSGWYYYCDTLYAATECSGGLPVFHKGVWAEIIKDEPIKIGGYEVVFNSTYITVNACAYTKTDLQQIYHVLKMEQVRSLNVGCNGQFKVDLEAINQILDRLK